MTGTARKLLFLLGTGTRGRWLLVIALALAVGIVEALGGVLVFVLLGLVTGAETAFVLPVVGDFRSLLPGVDPARLFLLAALVIAGFFLGRAVLVVGQAYLEQRVAENAGARLADRVARGYLSMPYEFHLRRNSAELIRNAFDTVQELVQHVFVRGVRLVAETMIIAALLVVLLVTAPLATVLVLAIVLPLNFLMLRVVHPRLKRLGALRQEQAMRSLQALQESLQGMRDIKMLGREQFFADVFARSRAGLARSRYLRGVLLQVPFVVTETVLVLAIVTVFVVTIVRGDAAIEALPVLGLFAYAGLRLKPSLNAIVMSLNSIRYAGPAIDHVHDDVRAVEHAPRSDSPGSVEPLPFVRRLQADRVSFRYQDAVAYALRDVSLRVDRGTSVGLVGPTGGGKTTLVDILVGLLEPSEGAVRVDGVDIRGVRRAWQENIGMVPQMIFLIDETLRQNIAFGVVEREIDETAVAEAVRLAQLDNVVAELPDGLDTVVGERGIRLSGGQRQRIAIARALYRRPNVLVFDEGTSALDTGTEQELMKALTALRGDRTLIIVAHRLSTVRDCDLVALITGGRLVDSGTFEELVDRNAEFRRLAQSVV